jgi:hypothetical protein
LAYSCKKDVEKLLTDENTVSMKILLYITQNFNSVPIKELTPMKVDGDKTCEAPKSHIPIGHFQGLKKGCFCSPLTSASYVSVDSGNQCNDCPSKKEYKAVEPKIGTIWKNYYLCAEYFKTEEYTNIMA